MDRLHKIHGCLRNDCIRLDKQKGRTAKGIANPDVEYADEDQPASAVEAVMWRKKYDQMPVKRKGGRTIGMITRQTIEKGIYLEGKKETAPAGMFCEDAYSVPWSITETETVEEVIRHGYVLVREQDQIVGIVTKFDFPPWAMTLI